MGVTMGFTGGYNEVVDGGYKPIHKTGRPQCGSKLGIYNLHTLE